MEDNAVKAIIIAAVLTILIITMSAIIMYYNQAVELAEVALSKSTDYSDLYTRDITEIKDMNISGTEVVSVIRNGIKDYTSIAVECDGITITVAKDIINNAKDSNLANINKSDNYRVIDVIKSGDNLTLKLIKTAL